MSASDDTTNEPVLRFITKDKSGPGYYDGNDPAIVRALAIAALVDERAKSVQYNGGLAWPGAARAFIREVEARIAKPAPQPDICPRCGLGIVDHRTATKDGITWHQACYHASVSDEPQSVVQAHETRVIVGPGC